MANGKKDAASVFQEMLKEDRNKRKHAQLAQEMLGKNRRQSAPPAAGRNRAPLGGSLASRVGVNKRAAPRSNSTAPRNANGPSRPPMSNNNSRAPSNLGPQGRAAAAGPSDRGNISIRGSAGNGQYMIIASNFAPGTTAKDIEDSLIQGANLYPKSVRIRSNSPTVIAELCFSDASDADRMIETYNNMRADDHLLHVFYKYSNEAQAAIAQYEDPDDAYHEYHEQANQLYDYADPYSQYYNNAAAAPAPVAQPAQEPSQEPVQIDDDDNEDSAMMEADEAATAREAEDRLREERKGGETKDRRDPSDGNGGRGYYEDWTGAAPAQGYNNGRNGGNGQGGAYEQGGQGGGYRQGGGYGQGGGAYGGGYNSGYGGGYGGSYGGGYRGSYGGSYGGGYGGRGNGRGGRRF